MGDTSAYSSSGSARAVRIAPQRSSSPEMSPKRFRHSPSRSAIFQKCAIVCDIHSRSRSMTSRFSKPIFRRPVEPSNAGRKVFSSYASAFFPNKTTVCLGNVDIRINYRLRKQLLNNAPCVLRFCKAVPIFSRDTRSGRDTRNWNKTMDHTLTT